MYNDMICRPKTQHKDGLHSAKCATWQSMSWWYYKKSRDFEYENDIIWYDLYPKLSVPHRNKKPYGSRFCRQFLAYKK